MQREAFEIQGYHHTNIRSDTSCQAFLKAALSGVEKVSGSVSPEFAHKVGVVKKVKVDLKIVESAFALITYRSGDTKSTIDGELQFTVL